MVPSWKTKKIDSGKRGEQKNSRPFVNRFHALKEQESKRREKSKGETLEGY